MSLLPEHGAMSGAPSTRPATAGGRAPSADDAGAGGAASGAPPVDGPPPPWGEPPPKSSPTWHTSATARTRTPSSSSTPAHRHPLNHASASASASDPNAAVLPAATPADDGDARPARTHTAARASDRPRGASPARLPDQHPAATATTTASATAAPSPPPSHHRHPRSVSAASSVDLNPNAASQSQSQSQSQHPLRLHMRTNADTHDDPMDGTTPTTPTVPALPDKPNGTGFILRIPAGAGAGAGFHSPSTRDTRGDSSRADSPAAASAGKRKRRSDNPTQSSTPLYPRPRRGGRGSSPGTTTPAAGTATSRDGSSAPSSRATPAATGDVPAGGALSIFAEGGVERDVADEVKTIVGPSASRTLRERERSIREDSASVALARPSRGGETHVRSGVSASGRGRRVGGSARVTSTGGGNGAVATRKKGKGKADGDFVNQDFCSVCKGIGRFLCCDGCPRSFHFMCLEPPLRIDELPQEETWYCKNCRNDRGEIGTVDNPARVKDKPIATVFKTLVYKVETENPEQFRLPVEIRQFFTGVSTGLRGEYVDAEGARNKLDRKGYPEERDPTRLRDSKQRPVQCYKCGGSAVPKHTYTTDPESSWRAVVSCDYCPLHWHLDCLSPPLATMPNHARKWMCPNHAEQVMPKRRTVRNGLDTVDVAAPGEHNNGNIVVIPDDEPRPAIPHEDMVINNRRYRVPERIIQLDFWNKLRLGRAPREAPARAAKRIRLAEETVLNSTREDLDAASLILALAESPTSSAPVPAPAPAPAPAQAPRAPPPRSLSPPRRTRTPAGTSTRPRASSPGPRRSTASPRPRPRASEGREAHEGRKAPNGSGNGNGAASDGSHTPTSSKSSNGDGPRRITLRVTRPE